jgi:Flp pilus assembly protein CpaB
VDIVASFEIERAPGLAEDEYILRTETILQNVEVISVAQEAQEPAAGASSATGDGENVSTSSGQIPDDVEEQPNAETLTLALSAADANQLISAQEYAVRIWAVVRAFGDNAIVDQEPVEVILVD